MTLSFWLGSPTTIMRADRALLGMLAVLLVAPTSRAQEVPAAPDLEFLEYLGSLVREGDRWVDPTDLRGPAEEERDRVAKEQPGVPNAAANGEEDERYVP